MPCHHLNQWWPCQFPVSIRPQEDISVKFQSIYTHFQTEKKSLGNTFCRMAAILFRSQCIDTTRPIYACDTQFTPQLRRLLFKTIIKIVQMLFTTTINQQFISLSRGVDHPGSKIYVSKFKFQTFSFKKMHLKIKKNPQKRWPFVQVSICQTLWMDRTRLVLAPLHVSWAMPVQQ